MLSEKLKEYLSSLNIWFDFEQGYKLKKQNAFLISLYSKENKKFIYKHKVACKNYSNDDFALFKELLYINALSDGGSDSGKKILKEFKNFKPTEKTGIITYMQTISGLTETIAHHKYIEENYLYFVNIIKDFITKTYNYNKKELEPWN